ncbi:MAG: anti-sigma factor [Sphingorhabdus sp.]|nr:anti-sigma factor [Sphingorhabdus sp.]
MTLLTQDDIALAGEYVLGLLDAAESASAAARAATDADFAAEVAAWRERMAATIDSADETPPAKAWADIERNLPAPSQQDTGKGGTRVWQAIAALSSIAAAYFAFIAWQPSTIVLPPEQPLIAALGGDGGKNANAVTARYEVANGQLLLTPVALDTGDLYPELWVIPKDGKPRSLGMITLGRSTQIVVTPEMREFIAQGATLAITPEQQSGAKFGVPTGPVIASGEITTI